MSKSQIVVLRCFIRKEPTNFRKNTRIQELLPFIVVRETSATDALLSCEELVIKKLNSFLSVFFSSAIDGSFLSGAGMTISMKLNCNC